MLLDSHILDFMQDDYNYIVSGWESKLKRQDEQKWGLFIARKPL